MPVEVPWRIGLAVFQTASLACTLHSYHVREMWQNKRSNFRPQGSDLDLRALTWRFSDGKSGEWNQVCKVFFFNTRAETGNRIRATTWRVSHAYRRPLSLFNGQPVMVSFAQLGQQSWHEKAYDGQLLVDRIGEAEEDWWELASGCGARMWNERARARVLIYSFWQWRQRQRRKMFSSSAAITIFFLPYFIARLRVLMFAP